MDNLKLQSYDHFIDQVVSYELCMQLKPNELIVIRLVAKIFQAAVKKAIEQGIELISIFLGSGRMEKLSIIDVSRKFRTNIIHLLNGEVKLSKFVAINQIISSCNLPVT